MKLINMINTAIALLIPAARRKCSPMLLAIRFNKTARPPRSTDRPTDETDMYTDKRMHKTFGRLQNVEMNQR